ncbi:MAG TPA: winged helix-turn-helix domain-containing protein [Streptosporangiaceae bacterium]
MTIDHFSDEPRYLQVAALLREMIKSGEIRPREPLPSIKTITQRYEVAKGTAEKALNVLRAEGLVRTVPGRGVYVVPREH